MIHTRGFDTSYWNHGPADRQQPIDFQAAYGEGYRFWFGRLTRGQNYIDTWIERDYAGASLTPLVKAVYHVLWPGEPVGPHIDNLRRGLALLSTPPAAIGLDLERGSEFGAAAVTACLRDTVLAIRSFYSGKLMLYSNLNYLTNYVTDTFGLDIWIAWPSPGDIAPIDDWVLWQKSWTQEIPGLPDTTVDLDVFNGDETVMLAYFGGETPEPEQPPDTGDDEMPDITEELSALAESLGDMQDAVLSILSKQGVILPPPDDGGEEPPLPDPTPLPYPDNTWEMTVKNDPRAKTWCFQVWNETRGELVDKLNAVGKPEMQEYRSEGGNLFTYAYGTKVRTYTALVDADGSLDYYEIYNVFGDHGQRLYLLKDHVRKPY